jgi:hypothetical protein
MLRFGDILVGDFLASLPRVEKKSQSQFCALRYRRRGCLGRLPAVRDYRMNIRREAELLLIIFSEIQEILVVSLQQKSHKRLEVSVSPAS